MERGDFAFYPDETPLATIGRSATPLVIPLVIASVDHLSSPNCKKFITHTRRKLY